MFNNLFNNNSKGGCGDCTWLILIVLFVCCCCNGHGNKSFNLRINPCCLLLIAALLWCCGAIGVDNNRDC